MMGTHQSLWGRAAQTTRPLPTRRCLRRSGRTRSEIVDLIEVLAEHHEVHLHDLAIVRHEKGGHINLLFRDRAVGSRGRSRCDHQGALAGIMFPPALGGPARRGWVRLQHPSGVPMARTRSGFLDALGTAVEEGDCAVRGGQDRPRRSMPSRPRSPMQLASCAAGRTRGRTLLRQRPLEAPTLALHGKRAQRCDPRNRRRHVRQYSFCRA